LTTDGTNLYALQGGTKNGFWRYNLPAGTWTQLTDVPTGGGPGSGVAWGGALTRIGNFIYAFQGNGKATFFRYDIGAGTWSTRAAPPGKVADGGALTTDGTFVYAFQGKSTAFWRYNPVTNAWVSLATYTAATNQGGALTFVPAVNQQGRFTTLDA